MASPCHGTGLVAGKFCPQCNGNPHANTDCAEVRRRTMGQEVQRIFETGAAQFTSGTPITVRHPLGRVPAHVEPVWLTMPYYKPAMTGGPAYAATWTLTFVRREAGEIEYKLEHPSGAEPGSYRLILYG